jgi:hypothetical protein
MVPIGGTALMSRKKGYESPPLFVEKRKSIAESRRDLIV